MMQLASLGPPKNCRPTSPLSGGCAPFRIEYLSAAALPDLLEKDGMEDGAGFKAQAIYALAVG
jgi:hypothetical protein